MTRPSLPPSRYPLSTLLADHEDGHTEFQMEHLIVAKTGLTLFGRYRQVLRELSGRAKAVRGLELERSRLDADRTRWEGKWCLSRAARKHRDYELLKLSLELTEWHKSFRTARRELKAFYRIACRLRRRLGRLTPARRQQLEEHYWVTRVLALSAVDFLSGGGLRDRTIELYLALPLDLRKRTLDKLQDRNALIAWIENYEPAVCQSLPLPVNNSRLC